MKPTRVTPAGLEVFEEVSTTYEFLVSDLPSQKNQNQSLPYKLVDIGHLVNPPASRNLTFGSRFVLYSTIEILHT